MILFYFQLISKLAEVTPFKNLFSGRSLDADTAIEFAGFALDAIKKFEKLNNE